MNIIKFPFKEICDLLRDLSLDSTLSNAVAVAIYVILGGLPLCYLLWKTKVRKCQSGMRDILLILLSAFMYFQMYLMINPRKMTSLVGSYDGGYMDLAMTFYTLLIGYIILSIVDSFRKGKAQQLLQYLKGVLIFTMAIFAVSAVLSVVTGWSSAMAWDNVILILKQFSIGFDIWVMVYGIKLIDALKKNKFSNEVLHASKRLSDTCAVSIGAMVVIAIVIDFMQILSGGMVLNQTYNINIPIVSMVAILIVLLVSKFISEAKAIKEDNEMII